MLLIPNSILAYLFFRPPVSRAFVAGSVVAVAGIALMMAPEAARVRSDRVLLGAALAVAGLMSASVANVMQGLAIRSEAQPSELPSLLLYLSAVFCLKRISQTHSHM